FSEVIVSPQGLAPQAPRLALSFAASVSFNARRKNSGGLTRASLTVTRVSMFTPVRAEVSPHLPGAAEAQLPPPLELRLIWLLPATAPILARGGAVFAIPVAGA